MYSMVIFVKLDDGLKVFIRFRGRDESPVLHEMGGHDRVHTRT